MDEFASANVFASAAMIAVFLFVEHACFFMLMQHAYNEPNGFALALTLLVRVRFAA